MHHPQVERFIQAFEEEAARNGHYRKQLGKYERKFLEEVWGPAFQYTFDGLRPEYPFKDFKGGARFADFVYAKAGIAWSSKLMDLRRTPGTCHPVTLTII